MDVGWKRSAGRFCLCKIHLVDSLIFLSFKLYTRLPVWLTRARLNLKKKMVPHILNTANRSTVLWLGVILTQRQLCVLLQTLGLALVVEIHVQLHETLTFNICIDKNMYFLLLAISKDCTVYSVRTKTRLNAAIVWSSNDFTQMCFDGSCQIPNESLLRSNSFSTFLL